MDLPDIIDELDYILPDEINESNILAFDDEPLEQILYGKVSKGPTPAGIYLPSRIYIRRIVVNYKEGKIKEMIEHASELSKKKYMISQRMYWNLLYVMKGLIPGYPMPVLKFDLSALGPLLKKMWNHSLTTKDEELQMSVGCVFYRWYEHLHEYESARHILNILIKIAKEKKDQIGEAVFINNFAFEYLLEGRWHDSAPIFLKAANIFKEKKNDYEYINARANYWTARCEYADFEEIENAEIELKEIADKLEESSDWRIRKPLMVLAKIEKKRKNLSGAIKLVKQAIKWGKKSNTRFPEMDKEVLIRLQSKYVQLKNTF